MHEIYVFNCLAASLIMLSYESVTVDIQLGAPLTGFGVPTRVLFISAIWINREREVLSLRADDLTLASPVILAIIAFIFVGLSVAAFPGCVAGRWRTLRDVLEASVIARIAVLVALGALDRWDDHEKEGSEVVLYLHVV